MSGEQIELLHSVLNMFLLTIFSLFVSLLIEEGKEVIFPNSKRINSSYIG